MDGERWQRYSRPGPRPWIEAGGEDPHLPRRLDDYIMRFLLHLAVLALAVLVLVQTLLLVPAMRRVMVRVEQLEGQLSVRPGDLTAEPVVGAGASGAPESQEAIMPALGRLPMGRVTVALVSQPAAPAVRMRVNGRPVASFTSGAVTLQVSPGEELTLDATEHAGALTFRVVEAVGLTVPPLGAEWTAHGDVTSLGIVRTP